MDSVALLNQIRAVDKQRLVRRLGTLKPETMERVGRAILISMDLIKI
jgi:mRNA interferase MazF